MGIQSPDPIINRIHVQIQDGSDYLNTKIRTKKKSAQRHVEYFG